MDRCQVSRPGCYLGHGRRSRCYEYCFEHDEIGIEFLIFDYHIFECVEEDLLTNFPRQGKERCRCAGTLDFRSFLLLLLCHRAWCGRDSNPLFERATRVARVVFMKSFSAVYPWIRLFRLAISLMNVRHDDYIPFVPFLAIGKDILPDRLQLLFSRSRGYQEVRP